MKSLNPYCPRNQGVTPITNGGTGATTAEDALAALGGAPADVLAGVLTGYHTNNWAIGVAIYGWGLVITLNIANINANISDIDIYNGEWHPLTENSSSRMGGNFHLICTIPEWAENGRCYLVRFNLRVTQKSRRKTK